MTRTPSHTPERCVLLWKSAAPLPNPRRRPWGFACQMLFIHQTWGKDGGGSSCGQCKQSSLGKTNNGRAEERASHACAAAAYSEENAAGKEVPRRQGHCQPPLSTHLKGGCDRNWSRLWPSLMDRCAGQGVAKRQNRSKEWRQRSGASSWVSITGVTKSITLCHHRGTSWSGGFSSSQYVETRDSQKSSCLFLQFFEYWKCFWGKKQPQNKTFVVVVNLFVDSVRFEFWAISWVLFRAISELMTRLLWELGDSTFFFLCVRN